jgi:hypothetical protein
LTPRRASSTRRSPSGLWAAVQWSTFSVLRHKRCRLCSGRRRARTGSRRPSSCPPCGLAATGTQACGPPTVEASSPPARQAAGAAWSGSEHETQVAVDPWFTSPANSARVDGQADRVRNAAGT